MGQEVFVFGVPDRLFIDIDPDDLLRGFCKQVTSVAFSRGQIQHSLVPDELCGKGIAMQVFVADLGAFHPGNVSFACPLDHANPAVHLDSAGDPSRPFLRPSF